MKWSAGEEAGTWAGVLIRRSAPGVSALVDFKSYCCPSCSQWHEQDGFHETEMPVPGTVYYSVTAHNELPECAEECGVEIEDDDPSPPAPVPKPMPQQAQFDGPAPPVGRKTL